LDHYTEDAEAKRQWLFARLSENDRQRYAGIEAAKPGHGGIDFLYQFGCSSRYVVATAGFSCGSPAGK